MGKILVIAEKPSVGRDIAKTLKATQKGDNCLFSDEYIVSWAIGHLVTLFDPEDYDKALKKWDMNTLPIMPDEIQLKASRNKGIKEQFSLLKKMMNSKDVSSLICATDSGREGELIFRYIYALAKCKKPFSRLWISSMTDKAIKDGFANLKDGSEFDNLYLSAKCRSESDWLVGINATRAYTIRYNTLLSIGRVQTPTLGILVDRQIEINNFVSQEYFEIKGEFENYEGTWFTYSKDEDKSEDLEKSNKEYKKTDDAKDGINSKILDKNKAEEIVKLITGQEGVVHAVEKEEKKQSSPLLYDLTELQRDCNRRFGLTAQQTLSIAQDLYEKRKVITYPRTDSRYLSDDMIGEISATLKKLNIEPYDKYVSYVLGLSKLPISKRIIDNSKVTDHHAIIPSNTKPAIHALSDIEFKVYDLIVKRFISVFYPPHVYSTTKIISQVKEHFFITRGKTILKQGYMELYLSDKTTSKKKNNDNEESLLPDLKKGDAVKLEKCNLLNKKTSPPRYYNEASLLSAMENAGRFVDNEDLKEQLKESGIGTPATRASIIERLIAVEYVKRNKKDLVPTEKGMKIIEIIPKELKSPETTGKWEKALGKIAKGEMEEEKFMGSIKRYVEYLINHAREQKNNNVNFPMEQRKNNSKNTNHGKPVNALGTCPLCKKGQVLENTKAYYCTMWREGCKFTLWKNILKDWDTELTPELITRILTGDKQAEIITVHPQTQEKYKGQLILKPDGKSVEIINSQRIVD